MLIASSNFLWKKHGDARAEAIFAERQPAVSSRPVMASDNRRAVIGRALPLESSERSANVSAASCCRWRGDRMLFIVEAIERFEVAWGRDIRALIVVRKGISCTDRVLRLCLRRSSRTDFCCCAVSGAAPSRESVEAVSAAESEDVDANDDVRE